MPQVAPDLRSYVEEKRVEGPLLERLALLSAGELGPLMQIIRVTNPSANTLRELLRTADEIAKRDAAAFSSVLASIEVQSILEAEGFSRKEKQKQLRVHFDRLRYPIFTQIEERLKDCQRRILAKTGLKLEYPEDLEGDQIRIELRARSAEELAKLGRALSELEGNADCAELFAVLKGES